MKTDVEKYQDKLMGMAKGTIKLGIVTGVGSNVVSRLGSSVPASKPAVGAINTALGLTAIGNMANIGMNLMPETKKQKTKSNEVNKMLGL